MTIRFFDFVAGNTNIADRGEKYVTGWIVDIRDPDYGTPAEVLFARHSDGRVMVSGPFPKPNPNFNRTGRKWAEEPDGVPADAEFCGHYLDDMF